jgi:hypothetical protein
MTRTLLLALLLLPPQEISDPTEEAVESAEVWLGGVAEQLRTFSVDSVRAAYAESFRGETFFNPLPDPAKRELGPGITLHSIEEKDRKQNAGDLLANLAPLASIEDLQFKFPSASWEAPRLTCRLKVTLVGRDRDGAGVMWQEEYDASLRKDADRWSFATCDRVLSRRQRAARPWFADTDAGLSLPLMESDVLPVFDEPYASLGGVAVGDYDGDGDDDLCYPNIGRTHLFRNDGGRFTEVTDEAAIAPGGAGASALFLDADGDGDLDLLAVHHATAKIKKNGELADNADRALTLYRNDRGRFTDVTDASKLASKGPATSCSAADIDGDGDLDLYIAMYADIINEEQMILGMLPRGSVVDSRDGVANQLWRNNGDGTFTEVARAAGVADEGRTYACAFADLDGDFRPDLVVANDFLGTSAYRNKGDGTFEPLAAFQDRGFGMGVAAGDIDRDGRDEIYLSNMYSTAGNRILGRNAAKLTEEQRKILLKLARGNTMLKAKEGRFEDVTAASATARAGWAWGCGFADLDLDGHLDLYVCSGYVTGTTRADL